MMTPTRMYTKMIEGPVSEIGLARAQEQAGVDGAANGDELYVAIAQATLHLAGLVQAFDRLEFARSLLCTTIHIRIGHTDFISLCRPIVSAPDAILVQNKFKLYHRNMSRKPLSSRIHAMILFRQKFNSSTPN